MSAVSVDLSPGPNTSSVHSSTHSTHEGEASPIEVKVNQVAEPIVNNLSQLNEEPKKDLPDFVHIDPNSADKGEVIAAKSYKHIVFTIVTVVGALILALGVLMLLSQVLPHAGALTPIFNSISTFTTAGAAGMGLSGLAFSSLILGSGVLVTGVGVGGLVHNQYTERRPNDFLKSELSISEPFPPQKENVDVSNVETHVSDDV